MIIIINLGKWEYIDWLENQSDIIFIGKYIGFNSCKYLNNVHIYKFENKKIVRYSNYMDCYYIFNTSVRFIDKQSFKWILKEIFNKENKLTIIFR